MNPYPRHTDDTAQITLDVERAGPAADEPPDQLAEELEAVAPRRWKTRTTLALASLVLLVGGFAGGVDIEKRWGAGDVTAAAGLPRPQSSGGFGGPATSDRTTGADTTTGTVKLVDGDTVYITTPDGQTVIVKTSSATTVATAQGGSLKDLTTGATVSVQGQAGSDGTITATTITKAR